MAIKYGTGSNTNSNQNLRKMEKKGNNFRQSNNIQIIGGRHRSGIPPSKKYGESREDRKVGGLKKDQSLKNLETNNQTV